MSFEWQEEFIKYAYDEGVGFPAILSKLNKVRLKFNTVLSEKCLFGLRISFSKKLIL